MLLFSLFLAGSETWLSRFHGADGVGVSDFPASTPTDSRQLSLLLAALKGSCRGLCKRPKKPSACPPACPPLSAMAPHPKHTQQPKSRLCPTTPQCRLVTTDVILQNGCPAPQVPYRISRSGNCCLFSHLAAGLPVLERAFGS